VYAEVLETYETIQRLAPEQETIARFWSDDPGETATPPGHSLSIATCCGRGGELGDRRNRTTCERLDISCDDAMMLKMRTTLTLDPDVADRLRALARERGLPFKQVVNAVLRRGLDDGSRAREAFRVEARAMRLRPGVDLDQALELAAHLEDEETLRKLELRK